MLLDEKKSDGCVVNYIVKFSYGSGIYVVNEMHGSEQVHLHI